MRRNTILRAALTLLVSAFTVSVVRADSFDIQLASVGTAANPGQTNSLGPTIAISADPVWAAALPGSNWVSFAQTDDQSSGFYLVPNGTVVSFFDTFNVPGTATGGSLSILADDSASVILNGVTLLAAGSTVGNTYQDVYGACSDFGIGCVVATTIELPASDLQTGSNTIEFQVEQEDGGSYGLDYAGYVTDPVNTPEPSPAILLGIGMAILVALRHARSWDGLLQD
jgi:hypothetical protein